MEMYRIRETPTNPDNLETVAGILRLWWTGRTFPFILPVQPFSEEGQL